MEHRKDCDSYEPKEFPHQCGGCQTDGHFLCGGCKHIAPFEQMEVGDNAERYYPDQYKNQLEEEKRQFEENKRQLEERAERLRRMSMPNWNK